ncbi:MAG: type II secretion system F family protein [Candidatus Omnitrophota bacterium]
MSLYRYTAKKGPQEVMEGQLEAASEKEAVEKINALGLIPMRVEEEVTLSASAASTGKSFGKVKTRQITVFSRQLATLIRSGVPILRAIHIIMEQSESRTLKAVLGDIHDNLKEGSTFSSSLAAHPDCFSPLYIAMIRAGEDTGALPEALLRVTDYRMKQEEFISRLRMALAYPVLMAIVGAATIVFMLTFVIPRLTKIFLSMGQELPLPTQILISISRGLSEVWVWLALSVIILILIQQSKTGAGKAVLSRLKIRLPLFGSIILKVNLSRFCRTLELLIKSGIPILKAIDIAVAVINNEVVKEKLKTSHKELEQGGSFGKSLKTSGLLPSFMTNLVIVGEESGKLAEALSEVADTYERETDEAVRIMTNLLEPLMILVMGLIVAFIVIAMLLPIFEINLMAR